MALKDLLALVDDKLADVFSRKGYDADKDRAKLVKRIENTKSKFLATEPPRGRKDFAVANNVVRYEPTLNGNAVAIDGRTTLHVPAERFADFLDQFSKMVSAGEFDSVMEAAAKGDATAAAPKTVRAPRKPREASEGAGGRGWSEERRAKFAATVAARNAAKQG